MKYPEEIRRLKPSRYVYRHADTDHPCDGCAGECTIHQGDTMLVSWNGEGTEHHFCSRCFIAIDVKMRVRPDHSCAVLPGSLRWANLSNIFRKEWRKLCADLQRLGYGATKTQQDEAVNRFYTAMGIDVHDELLNPGVEADDETAGEEDAAAAAKAKRHEQYIRRKEARMKKEQDEIRRLAADLSALKQTVAGKAAELARHFLAAKVAHIKGEKAKYDEAHGASAAILVELQRLAEVTA